MIVINATRPPLYYSKQNNVIPFIGERRSSLSMVTTSFLPEATACLEQVELYTQQFTLRWRLPFEKNFKCGFSREENSRVHESCWATC
jgi:hypothetical protein